MVSQMLILQGGDDIEKRGNESLIRIVRSISVTGKVLVIPWTTDSVDDEYLHRKSIVEYFSECGFSEVLFLDRDMVEYETEFSKVDVIYLPGGDPGILYREIRKRNIEKLLRNFNGTVIGNSAGAIVMSRGTRSGKKFQPGFGLVNAFVEVHYKTGSGDQVERDLSPEGLVVKIPEGKWVAVPMFEAKN